MKHFTRSSCDTVVAFLFVVFYAQYVSDILD